ncbi:MAG: type II toxin-antitoxin system Phd/YefM family antitoxin [Hyphomicrobium sp.]
METVPIEALGDRLPDLARRVEQDETVVVTREGKPILDLVPHKRRGGLDAEGGRRFLAEHGIEKIVTYIAPDFDDPLPEDFLITPTSILILNENEVAARNAYRT